jgi:hypothetical protein
LAIIISAIIILYEPSVKNNNDLPKYHRYYRVGEELGNKGCCNNKAKEEIIPIYFANDFMNESLKGNLTIVKEKPEIIPVCEAIISKNQDICPRIKDKKASDYCSILVKLKIYSSQDNCKGVGKTDIELCDFVHGDSKDDCNDYGNPVLKGLCKNDISAEGLDCEKVVDPTERIICECFLSNPTQQLHI